MDIAYITAVIVATLVGWISFVRLPNWCFRSVHRHRLWETRDAIADSILRGQLPKEHDAVQELLVVAERSAKATHQMTILDLYYWRGVHRRCDLSKTRILEVSLDGLTEQERDLLLKYRERVTTLGVRSMIVGSWLGICAILVRVIPALVKALGEAHRHRARTVSRGVRGVPLKASLITAANEASESSSVGQAARQFINVEDGVLDVGRSNGGREAATVV